MSSDGSEQVQGTSLGFAYNAQRKRKRFNAEPRSDAKPKRKKTSMPFGSIEHRAERRSYLSKLRNEFSVTSSPSGKLEVLANLSNFCYDPYNYEILKQLGIIDILLLTAKNALNAMKSARTQDKMLLKFSVAALCNLSSDPFIAKTYITPKKKLFVDIVSYCGAEIPVEARSYSIYTLMNCHPFLQEAPLKCEEVQRLIDQFGTNDRRIKNLCVLYMNKYMARK